MSKPIERNNEVDDPQEQLFETEWMNEWVGMPEFIQEKMEPYATVVVRFSNQRDMEDFAARLGQPITPKTKSIWHPQLLRGINRDKRYVDES